MRRPALLPLVVALLLAPRAARADGLYFTEAFGGTRFKNHLSSYIDGAVQVHAGLGFRAHRTSVEGWIGADISTAGDAYDSYEPSPSPVTYGLDLKRAFPVSSRVEAYLRVSMSRMFIEEGALDGYGGRGLGAGAGIQLKGKVPLLAMLYPPIALVCLIPNTCRKLGPMGTAALYIDQGWDFYRLHRERSPSIDAEAARLRVGFAIGTDF
jgi:hypothetical protein